VNAQFIALDMPLDENSYGPSDIKAFRYKIAADIQGNQLIA
jgi:hypothetical protein